MPRGNLHPPIKDSSAEDLLRLMRLVMRRALRARGVAWCRSKGAGVVCRLCVALSASSVLTWVVERLLRQGAPVVVVVVALVAVVMAVRAGGCGG